ncbi:polysaccharide lyase family 7 protein [Streptomyces sp. B6B3]|uniref:polysaccharide lyase family 7 protein n=1 Tax=Streptomyces sp. B6B3 TaxID=3153570 RepID=UPI00325C70CA
MTRRRTIVLTSITAAASAGVLALPAQAATPAPRDGQCQYPAEVLDLANWKMTLPTGGDEDPTEITQPELATFSADPYFQVNEDCTAVIFRSPVDGVTTGGSSYPRAELREMTDGGQEEAAWSASEGTHTMVVTEAFVALPNDKPHLVGAQVHGGDDDVTVFRLEGSSLYVTNGDDSTYHLVTDNYQLGTEFEAKFVASGGEIDVYYNGQLETTIAADGDTNYFKAGAYTQANCDNSEPCDGGNFGEVHISDIEVSHSDSEDDGTGDGGSGDEDSGNDDGDSGDDAGNEDGGDTGDDEDAGDGDSGDAGAGDSDAGSDDGADDGSEPSTQTGDGADLAETGGSSATPLLVAGGLGLVAAGGAALVARRRAAARTVA